MTIHNRYTLYKKVARGGMAEIFLGKQTGEDGFQRICCIKRILPHFAQEEQFIEMFRDEAHIGKSLQHANIVRIEGFEAVDDSFAIIMEFINGSDLRLIVQACEEEKEYLSTPMAIYIIAEAARGLHYVHSKKDDISGKNLDIIHRDISPQNILVSFEGEVKVTDFGIADAQDKNVETKVGVVKGKYSYMSPEQISAQAIDGRTDIFALCVVLWEILTRKKLFQGENEIETIQKVRDCFIEKNIFDYDSNLDIELNNIVRKGLEKNPNDRFNSALDFEKTLRRYLNKHFPDFSSIELSNFLKKILKSRANSLATDIKNLLQQESKFTPKEVSIKKEKKETISEVKKVNIKSNIQPKAKATSQIPKKTKPQYQSKQKIVQKKTASTSKNFTLFYLTIFFLSSFVGSLLAFVKEKKINIINTKEQIISLSTIPESVKVKINDNYIMQGKYIKTPIKFKNISSKINEVILERDGYESKKISFSEDLKQNMNFNNIVLRQTEKMAPTKIFLSNSKTDKINFVLDSGLYDQELKRNNYVNIQKISFGKTHNLIIFPKFPKINDSFSCSFTPRAVSWKAPFLVEIKPDIKKCDYPIRYND